MCILLMLLVTTATTVSTTTIKAKGMKVENLRDVERKVRMNQNTLCACRLSNSISATARA